MIYIYIYICSCIILYNNHMCHFKKSLKAGIHRNSQLVRQSQVDADLVFNHFAGDDHAIVQLMGLSRRSALVDQKVAKPAAAQPAALSGFIRIYKV